MKRIKDFIYDYNDVLVALLIVVVAGFIIFWRVNVVMSYADIAEGGEVQQIDIDFSNIDLNSKEEVEDIKDPETDDTESEVTTPEEEVVIEPEEVVTPVEEETTTPAIEEPTVNKCTIEVSKSSGTTNWTAIGKKLQEKGIIEDYKDFVARVVERKDDTKLQYGTFEIDSTMTLDKMIDILIKK